MSRAGTTNWVNMKEGQWHGARIEEAARENPAQV